MQPTGTGARLRHMTRLLLAAGLSTAPMAAVRACSRAMMGTPRIG
jgi:hypothetical protein